MAETVWKMLIGSTWSEGTGDRSADLNPATGEVVGYWAPADAAQVAAAVAAADAARDAWRKTPPPKRADIVMRAALMLEQRKEDLSRLLTREMGKVLFEARGDVQEAIDMGLYIAGEGRRLFGVTSTSELPDKWAMSVREPVGVVALITPWNFPVAVPSWKLLPALVAGNTVVWKPSPETPGCAVRLAETLHDAGLPPGVLNLVFGDAAQGEQLVTDPRVRAVSFTGSTETGRRVMALAAEHGPKRVSLECGGKNAIIVLADADLDLAVEGILWAAFGTTGQRCTACSRLIVERLVAPRLLQLLTERAQGLRLGDGLDESVQVGPLISNAALEKVERYIAIAEAEGARLVAGGGRPADPALGGGHFCAPTIFAGVEPQMRIAREEVFGPVLAVIEVDSLDEAVAVNNDVDFGLSAALYTRDVNKAFRAMRDLATGIVYVGAGTTGSEVHLPFGGVRHTGNGHREAGHTAVDAFTEWKSIYVDYSGRLQRAQIDT